MFKKNKDILNIALPAMGENFLQMLMGMVDSYLVAHLGLIAISGVSVTGNIITIYQAIFIALGAAISSVISKSLGEKNQSKLAYHVTEALKITLLVSFLLGALSIFAGQEMIGLLGTEQTVAESGGLYLSLVGGSIVLLGLMTSLGALIRATHNPRLPLYVSILSNALNKQGQYELTDFDADILDLFAAEYATEEETAAEIKRVYDSDSYIEDPHTAVASAVYKKYQSATGDATKTVIASTASPYKFPVVAVEAVTGKVGLTDFEALAQLHEISGVAVPPAVDGLETALVRHKTTVAAADMQAAVEAYLGL